MSLGRFDAKGLAIKIQIESPRCAITPAHAIEGELLGEIAMRFGLKAVSKPILSRNRDIQEGGTQINKRHIESATIESHDMLIMFGDVPKPGQQLGFVHTRHKLNW